ncbi:MAG: sensor histidine kinase [Candidatus Promineifilaceae bacterium]
MTTYWRFGRIPARVFTPDNYLQLLGAAGICLAAYGFVSVLQVEDVRLFAWLTILTTLAEVTSAQHNAFDVTIDASSAVSFAAIPFFGIGGAVSILCIASFVHLISQYVRGVQKDNELLKARVNLGMKGGSLFLAGIVWTVSGPTSWWAVVLVWIVMAIVQDQVNFFLLMSIFRLNKGKSFRIYTAWSESYWAIFMSITVTVIGGGLIGYAIYRYDWEGVLLFYLPTLLSIVSFHTTVRNYKNTMSELETIVAERTSELKDANTELASTNGQLVSLNEDLTRANKANSRFLAVLSHDMRSPLTGIKLYGQLLQQRADMPVKKRTHMMQVILQNTQTLVELVDNLVEIEQSGGDKLALQIERVDLNSLMHEAAFNFDAHAAEKNITVDVQLASEPLVIAADRQLIKRSITNLISNAIKYTPNEGRVTVSVSREDAEANIRIADTGIGIPKDQIDKIFDSYHRVDEHRATAQGLGLGLSIVKRYIELHKGEIFVRSVVGEGSQFNVYLPLESKNEGSA